MCSKKSTAKVEESNKRRLQSLNERSNEFQLKKKLVRLSLHDLDSGAKKTKKIIFSDDDDEDDAKVFDSTDKKTTFNIEVIKPKKTATRNNDKQEKEAVEPKKMKLIDSNSDEDTSKDNDRTLKLLESKANLDQKKANKLIYLKTKFSNDDQRFKIDERFVEDEDSADESKATKQKETDESEEELDDHDDDDDESVRKPKKVNKKQLRKEKLKQLKILEEITAKPILKPPMDDADKDAQEKKTRETLKTKPIVRYDPTKHDHKKFELSNRDEEDDSENEESETSSSSSTSSSSVGSNSSDDDEDISNVIRSSKSLLDDEKKEKKTENNETNTQKYFQIEPNLKDLFVSNDVFKFKFADDDDNDYEEENYKSCGDDFSDDGDSSDKQKEQRQRLKSSILDATSFKASLTTRYSSSSSSESDSGDLNDETENEYPDDYNYNNTVVDAKRKQKPSTEQPEFKSLKTFLPDFDNDNDIHDALEYFGNKAESADLENFRNNWTANREKLLQECKKKNKRMIRIKKAKDNQKVLPWKTSNKSILNRNRWKKN